MAGKVYEESVEQVQAFVIDAFTTIQSAFGTPTRFDVTWDDFSSGPFFVGVGFTAYFAALAEPPESKRRLASFCGKYLMMKSDGKKSLHYGTRPECYLSAPYCHRLGLASYDDFERAAAQLRKRAGDDASFFPADEWNFADGPEEAIQWSNLATRKATWAAVDALKKDKRLRGVELSLHPHDNELTSVEYFAKNAADNIAERRESLDHAPSDETIDAFLGLLTSDAKVRASLRRAMGL